MYVLSTRTKDEFRAKLSLKKRLCKIKKYICHSCSKNLDDLMENVLKCALKTFSSLLISHESITGGVVG